MEHNETRLQMAVVSYLKGEIRSGKNIIRVQSPFPDLLWLHPVNEFKDATEAFWGKAKGILPGASDLLFWFWGRFGGIELKTDKGYQSLNQKDFAANLKAHGGLYEICRSVSEVRDQLIAWGLTCKNTHCIEPAPSAKSRMAAHTAPILEALAEKKRQWSKKDE